MKALLNAIRAAILANTTLEYLDDRVYIAPDTSNIILFPESYRCPCVVLSDLGEDVEWHPGKIKRVTRKVEVSGFVYLRSPEGAIMGDGTQKGAIDLIEDLQALLLNNCLGLANYVSALTASVSVADPFFIKSQDEIAIRKSVIINYIVDPA